ncbi:MAG TPA: hypothetical protein VK473_13605 [Terriglobales bacterium]|nr:hypothetical protein [Terriglobales bacterium]
MRLQITFFFLLVGLAPALMSQTIAERTSDANQIMASVLLHDTERESRSGGYAGHRRYVLDNDYLQKHAELVADVSCDSAGVKHFNVVTEDGWKAANKHVLRKMLESESETSTPSVRPQTRLTPDNYRFTMAKSEVIGGRLTYLIDVTPKRREKYLIEGRVWIDAQDFALVRAEGKPARNPSFWTRSIHFVHQYQKNGSYWFPTSTLSVTQARLFGTTQVNIEYYDYEPNLKSDLDSLRQSTVQFKEATHVTN